MVPDPLYLLHHAISSLWVTVDLSINPNPVALGEHIQVDVSIRPKRQLIVYGLEVSLDQWALTDRWAEGDGYDLSVRFTATLDSEMTILAPYESRHWSVTIPVPESERHTCRNWRTTVWWEIDVRIKREGVLGDIVRRHVITVVPE